MMMVVIQFINVVFITITSMFFVSTKGMFVKRTFLNMPLYLFESSIIPIDKEENINPHFDLDVVKEKVIYYLNLNLKNEVSNYKISFFPYIEDEKNNKYYINLEDNIKNIQIHFVSKYFLDFKVDAYLCFILKEKGVIKSEF